MLGFEFGESVHFRRIQLQGRLGKLDSLWQTGLFVGYRTQSGEYMVANSEGAFKTRTMKRIPENGAFKTRTMKRIPENERWNKSEIEGTPCPPWKFKTSSGAGSPGETDRAGLDSFLDIEIDKSVSMSAPPRVADDAMPRRVFITRAVLNQYGITDGGMRQQYHWRNGKSPFRGVPPQDRKGDEK